MKKWIAGLGVLSLLVVSGCQVSEADREQEEKTNEAMKESQKQVGMPEIDEFYEKKMAKEIYELRDNSELVTYAYTQNMDGEYVYMGEAVGFGLPYSTQYTNPEKLMPTDDTTMPQPDPNGLFSPEGLSATWLMLVNEDSGEPEIVYTEPNIVVTQSKFPERLVADFSLPEDY